MGNPLGGVSAFDMIDVYSNTEPFLPAYQGQFPQKSLKETISRYSNSISLCLMLKFIYFETTTKFCESSPYFCPM